MKKFISNAWNIMEIAVITGGGFIEEHMAHRMEQQSAQTPPDPAALLFTLHQAAFALFWLGLVMVIVKAVDSPMQRALSEWAGMPPKLTVQPPLTPTPPAATVQADNQPKP